MKIRFYPAILPYFLEKVKAGKKEKDTNSGVVKEKDDRAAGGCAGGKKPPARSIPARRRHQKKAVIPFGMTAFFWWTITDSNR